MDISAASSEPIAPRKRWLERFLNSPLLLVALVLATAALGANWYALEQSLKAPILPGWSWAAHPNTLLIYYPHTDCGCGPGLSAAISEANARHFDVAVFTDVKGSQKDSIAYEVHKSKAYLLPMPDIRLLGKWLQGKNTTMLHIQNGKIVGHAQGTIIPKSF